MAAAVPSRSVYTKYILDTCRIDLICAVRGKKQVGCNKKKTEREGHTTSLKREHKYIYHSENRPRPFSGNYRPKSLGGQTNENTMLTQGIKMSIYVLLCNKTASELQQINFITKKIKIAIYNVVQ